MPSGYPDLAVMGSRRGSGQVDTEPPVKCVVQSTPACGDVPTTTNSSNTVGLVHAGKYAKEELNILQPNINGLQNMKIELVKLLQDQEVHIALLQETILPKKEQKSPSQDTLKSHVPAKKPTAPTVKASWHLLEMTSLEKQKILPTLILIGKKQQSGQSQEQNLPSAICTVHLVQTQVSHS